VTNKAGKTYFGSQFQRVQSMFAWPYTVGQNIVVVCGGGVSSPYDGQKAESKERTGYPI
jgi:hypothetical protein